MCSLTLKFYTQKMLLRDIGHASIREIMCSLTLKFYTQKIGRQSVTIAPRRDISNLCADPEIQLVTSLMREKS